MIDFGLELNIYEASYLTMPEEREIRRSWRERLLTFPWHPWKATKIVVVQVPDPHCYVVENMVLCHPVIAGQLRERIKGYEE